MNTQSISSLTLNPSKHTTPFPPSTLDELYLKLIPAPPVLRWGAGVLVIAEQGSYRFGGVHLCDHLHFVLTVRADADVYSEAMFEEGRP